MKRFFFLVSGLWFASLRSGHPVRLRSFPLAAIGGLWILASGISHAILDTNENGLSDFWEKEHNSGELFAAGFDPQADPDKDGWTNAQEATAGTNPFDPNPPDGLINPAIAQFPAVWEEEDEYGGPYLISPASITVTWPTLAGKQYTLHLSPDLSQGSWLPVGEAFVAYGGETTYGIEIGDPDKAFWRVKVEDIDSDGDGLTNHEEFLAGSNPAITDTDDDTLSDHAELIAGTDPLQADGDGDGWTDPQELAAGTASRNQDTDGDGIPDSIDTHPLVSAFAFADTDGDGIPDGVDADPNNPRGPAPAIASETASGNPISNLTKDEIVKFVLTVSNPAGTAPTATDLTLFLNGTEETTANITAIGNPIASSQRFLLTWTAKTTANYPTLTLQHLTLRFRDAQQATSWLNLARIDVAEWEGLVAMSPIRYVAADEEGISLIVKSHINGKRDEHSFGGPWNGRVISYRGSRVIPVLDSNSHNLAATFQIPAGIKFPLFLTRISGSFVSNISTIEAGDYDVFPHNAALFYNNFTSTIRYDWGGVLTEVPASSSKFQDYGTQWNSGPISIDWLQSGQWRPIAETMWSHASPFTEYVNRIVVSSYHPTPTETRVTGFSIYSKLPASITPHLAGTEEVPGLPIHPLVIEKDGTPLLFASETFHHIVFRVDSAVEDWTNGVKLRLARMDENYETLPPQAGIQLHQTPAGQPLPLDANGEILLSPTQNSTLFENLTGTEGLKLLLKRTSSTNELHKLQIRFVSKYETEKETTVASVDILPVDIVPDWNRDGKIDVADRGKVTEKNPWRFWVNDDNDSGETGGNDIPIPAPLIYTLYDSEPLVDRNATSPGVNGIRDLIDFFPLHLDLKAVSETFPTSHYNYYLKQEAVSSLSGAGGVVLLPSLATIWLPDAQLAGSPAAAGTVGSYLKNVASARTIANLPLHPISQTGLRIPDNLVTSFSQGSGIALVEARTVTQKPLVLEVRKKAGGSSALEIRFPLSITGVEDMFRRKYVMPNAATLTQNDIPANPSNWPDEDRNDKHFVFVHGYNVSGDQSRGWGAEMFKRLFWSGSNARFSAFAWRGNQSQVAGISPNYHANLVHAFNTGKSFAQFLNLIEGEKTVAAHSMGNILVGSAMHDWGARPENYLMLDSAAAKECYDPTEAADPTQDEMMENLAWRGYPKALRSSEWHNLPSPAIWPDLDKRRTLTWRGRLGGVINNGGQTDVYNFYSSGEEVLNNPTLTDPETNNAIGEPWLKPNRVWAVQEKRKGYGITGHVHSSNYGGWEFNFLPYNSALHVPDVGNPWGNHRMRNPSELPNPLTNQWLLQRTIDPFFNPSSHPTLYDPASGADSPGSDYAEEHRNTLISEMIPCTTFAAGRNEFINILRDDPNTPEDEGRNIDMNVLMKTDPTEWPLSNANENGQPSTDPASRPWLHSDIREKAFTHNWMAYGKFVEIGHLNQSE